MNMLNKARLLVLQYQLTAAEKAANCEVRAMRQARADEIAFQLKANRLRKKISALRNRHN